MTIGWLGSTIGSPQCAAVSLGARCRSTPATRDCNPLFRRTCPEYPFREERIDRDVGCDQRANFHGVPARRAFKRWHADDWSSTARAGTPVEPFSSWSHPTVMSESFCAGQAPPQEAPFVGSQHGLRATVRPGALSWTPGVSSWVIRADSWTSGTRSSETAAGHWAVGV
jgi:hypothetical protein